MYSVLCVLVGMVLIVGVISLFFLAIYVFGVVTCLIFDATAPKFWDAIPVGIITAAFLGLLLVLGVAANEVGHAILNHAH